METKNKYIRSSEIRDDEHPVYVQEHTKVIYAGKGRTTPTEIKLKQRWQKARGK